MFKVRIVLVLLVFTSLVNAKDIDLNPQNVINDYMEYTRVLVQNTVGFSAPISARAHAYISIAAHEASVGFLSEIQPLETKLSGYSRPEFSIPQDNCVLPVVLNQVYYDMMVYLFRGAPKYYLTELKAIYNRHDALHAKQFSRKLRKKSKLYAQQLSAQLIEWSKLDHGDEAYLQNYSDKHEIRSCDSCWVQTTPGYLPALLPYWRQNTTLIAGVKEMAKDYTTMAYDEDTSSLLYREAYDVFLNSKDEKSEFKIIAEYWDDGTGISGTPSGHLFSIAQHLAIQEKLSISDQLKLYSTLGIVLNDVVIACWELKYAHNFIRPITYIQRFIYPQFNTRIDTPSFPESPSGHSFHSGAAGAVFTVFFGDDVAFTDSTNAKRSDIVGDPRHFNSIEELVEEISISRFYGGIHFRKTLSESVACGEKLGNYILHHLQVVE